MKYRMLEIHIRIILKEFLKDHNEGLAIKKISELLDIVYNNPKKYPCPFDKRFKCEKGKTCKKKCLFMSY